jgi:putative ABC transport system substrate-binding protein
MNVRRRNFITLLGGAAAWPLAARAQQGERMRRVAVVSQFPEAEARSNTAAFQQRLLELGWTEGRNIRFDLLWGAADAATRRSFAAEAVALAPDVILASSAVVIEALQEQTRTIPIVFAGVIDPVGGGLVASLAHPGGNTTGFVAIEYSIGTKWLELLMQLAPSIKRVAVIRAPTVPGSGQFGAIQSAAPRYGVEVRPFYATQPAEIEHALADFAQRPDSGLIVTAGGIPTISIRDEAVAAIAARLRLPAVYFGRRYVEAGGLITYAPIRDGEYRQAAEYVDRILKGEKPGDLPVQAPTKYELVINLKTAKALGLAVPPTMLTLADEVIE